MDFKKLGKPIEDRDLMEKTICPRCEGQLYVVSKEVHLVKVPIDEDGLVLKDQAEMNITEEQFVMCFNCGFRVNSEDISASMEDIEIDVNKLM